MDDRIEIRDAMAMDVKFIAKCVIAAAHLADFEEDCHYNEQFNELCAMEDSLYSYTKTRVLTLDGKAVGCMVSYAGDTYEEARRKTFSFFTDEPEDIVVNTGTEAFPGEWYLDSLAILPEHRGKGYGTMLIEDAMKIAEENGADKVSLIAEKDSMELREYYGSFGFMEAEDIMFFGDPYIRMVKSIMQSTK